MRCATAALLLVLLDITIAAPTETATANMSAIGVGTIENGQWVISDKNLKACLYPSIGGHLIVYRYYEGRRNRIDVAVSLLVL
jgi:hypothetical protein